VVVSTRPVPGGDWRSRGGSCRKQTQRLTFNTRLCCADESMIEYVVVHELCHLIYADHSAHFWALVASCLPDYKQRQIALNRMDMTPKVP